MPLDKPIKSVKTENDMNRNLELSAPLRWLRMGWDDFRRTNMEASLLYGIVVTALSGLLVVSLFITKLDYLLFPALAAFMIIGPLFALGLYEKSRRIERSQDVSIGRMLSVETQTSKDHFAFIGLVLMLLVLLWLRAGVLVYALFFGMHSFPSLGGALAQIFSHSAGVGLILTGSVFGALFAALAFAISAFSIPMLLNEKTDAFTAMGTSIRLVWSNLSVLLVWGGIVVGLFIACLLSGLLGLIVAFPVLGHATWHMYREVREGRYTAIVNTGGSGDVHAR